MTKLKGSADRMIVRLGERVDVRHYTFGTEDEHGDADKTLTTNSPFTNVPARVDRGGKPTETRGQAQTSVDYDVRIYVAKERGATNGLRGAGEDEPPSEIERASGEVYRVLRTHVNQNGMVVSLCEVVTT